MNSPLSDRVNLWTFYYCSIFFSSLTLHKMHFHQLQIDNMYWFDCDFCPSMMFKFNFLVLLCIQRDDGFPLHSGFLSLSLVLDAYASKLIYVVSTNTVFKHNVFKHNSSECKHQSHSCVWKDSFENGNFNRRKVFKWKYYLVSLFPNGHSNYFVVR